MPKKSAKASKSDSKALVPESINTASGPSESILERSKASSEQPKDFRLPELKDFKNFLFLIFNHLKLRPTKIQYDICDTLQHGPKRLILSGNRSIGKSYISVAFVLWYLYWNPNAKVLVVSAAKNKADTFSQFCLKLIFEIEELKWMYPTEACRKSMVQFDLSVTDAAKDASVTSLGMYSQLTGSRADLIIADDVEVPKTSETHGAREKLAEAVKEFEAILKPEKESRIIYLGTPQCEDSLYNKLIARGYTRVIYPARIPGEKWMATQGHELAPIIKRMNGPKEGCGAAFDRGQIVDSDRYTELELVQKELSMGRSTFDLQYMLDTSLSDRDKFPLKLKDLLVMEWKDLVPELPVWSPDDSCMIQDLDSIGLRGDRWYRPVSFGGIWKPFEMSIMAIDPAGTGKDELAYCILKHLNGILYLTVSGGLEGGYHHKNLEFLVNLAKEHQVKSMVVESNFGDGMFERLLQPVVTSVYPCLIESVKHYKNKELRIIDILEPVMNAHKLVIHKDVVSSDLGTQDTVKKLFFQMTRITRTKGSLEHDDRLDCLAMAVNWYKTRIERDSTRGIEESRRKEFLKMIKNDRGFGGGKRNPPGTFISKILGH